MQPILPYFGSVGDGNQVKDVADGGKAIEAEVPKTVINLTDSKDDTLPISVVLIPYESTGTSKDIELNNNKVNMLESCGFPNPK